MEKDNKEISVSRVGDLITCPRCQDEQAHYDMNPETYEECIICINCGYIRDKYAVIDTEQQSPDGQKHYKRTDDGELIYEVYEHKGAGGYGIYEDGCGGMRYPLHDKPSEEEIKDFVKHLEETGAKGFMTLWDDKTQTVNFVVNKF